MGRFVILRAHEGHIGPPKVINEIEDNIRLGSLNGETDKNRYEQYELFHINNRERSFVRCNTQQVKRLRIITLTTDEPLPKFASHMTQRYEAIIIGGGGAGLMSAMIAGQRGRSVAVLEHNPRIGKKILISGGGRCNFTNHDSDPNNYISSNPQFCRSALSRYPSRKFVELVQKHEIEFYEKKLGQLFCKLSSRQIVELFEKECGEAGVRISPGSIVENIEAKNGFCVKTANGNFECESLVIATGALSYPKLGATDFGYRIARQFNVPIIQPRPGLVPIIPRLNNGHSWPFSELTGVSLDCIASVSGHAFRENLLFTHRGLSGPAILQISNYCPIGKSFKLNLLPEHNATDLLESARISKLKPKRWLEQWFPKRIADAFAKQFGPDQPLSQMKQIERDHLVRCLCELVLTAADTGGYAKAEVTVGGVDTQSLSSKTMECLKVPRLYFIGEVVDVTGWLGGYNFQWAWASGHAAGEVI